MLQQDFTITCQHGEVVTAQCEYGVTTYHHPDETGCDVFNSLGITFDDAMSVGYMHILTAKTPTTRQVVLHLVSRAARQSFYDYISRSDENTLRDALKRYLKIIQGASSEIDIMSELFTIFGAAMRSNIMLFTPKYAIAEEKISECSRMGCARLKSARDEAVSELDIDLMVKNKSVRKPAVKEIEKY